jgi:leucyl/phenylalanyl-tRNA---protein transferase
VSLFIIDSNNKTFPPPRLAEPDGLLAIGGDLSPERLLTAYKSGIFPWYQGDHILWWSPDPRFVLFPGELKINKTIKTFLKKNRFRFTTNQAFEKVIRSCKKITRPGQEGTWITDELEKAFLEMHQRGYAHSAELWEDEELVGGLYGMRIGKIFFGESMFSQRSNASRFCFVKYIELLRSEGVELIDCQVYTEYLESMGARMIDRELFLNLLAEKT